MKSSHFVLNSVPPAEPAAPWLGGKRHLAKRICEILARTPHDTYAEPFVGMGGVFLRRAMRPKVEVINDVSGDLVNLFRILRAHPEALLRELRWRPAMRAEFDRAKGARLQDATDVERAAAFLYLQVLSFGGKVRGRSYGVKVDAPYNFDLAKLEPRMRRIHDRLSGVVIENLDWADFIPRYARPATLFYLDPPYWGSEDDYGTGLFDRGDFEKLAAALRDCDAMVLLSINDVPEVRTGFAWAQIQEVETMYGIGGPQVVRELLIAKGVDLAAVNPQGSLF